MKVEPGPTDVVHLELLRSNVEALMRRAATQYVDGARRRLLDIAPQDHAGARPFFPPNVDVVTFDLDPSSGADVIGDLCRRNAELEDSSFDYVVCTEVLEHVVQPFAAVAEMRRVLKPGGHLFVSTPFNFRIHGPLPDCWRFTEHGLRVLLADFTVVELDALEAVDRPLMPVHYTAVARRDP